MTKAEKIEEERKFWAKIAKENKWYKEPFYVQVWFDKDDDVEDSIYAPKNAINDIIISS
ncbi:hypothetical protein [Arcobacter sp. F2176]|uniref:hypothetical protein n=1 Tax=Arcobacter sp. F2176 TaxID=2044511 RepID=UPI0013E96A39|nr:hypothetical protein [Arcobacter sp. F2176]